MDINTILGTVATVVWTAVAMVAILDTLTPKIDLKRILKYTQLLGTIVHILLFVALLVPSRDADVATYITTTSHILGAVLSKSWTSLPKVIGAVIHSIGVGGVIGALVPTSALAGQQPTIAKELIYFAQHCSLCVLRLSEFFPVFSYSLDALIVIMVFTALRRLETDLRYILRPRAQANILCYTLVLVKWSLFCFLEYRFFLCGAILLWCFGSLRYHYQMAE